MIFRTRSHLNSQDGVSQEQEDVSLTIPDLNLLKEGSIFRDESSDSNAVVTVIPSQDRITLHILSH
jgi:CRISPR/Cas system CSM-associated protein Csm4 (group 5 of RAMP superfamily)